jgi:hypothetical protein
LGFKVEEVNGVFKLCEASGDRGWVDFWCAVADAFDVGALVVGEGIVDREVVDGEDAVVDEGGFLFPVEAGDGEDGDFGDVLPALMGEGAGVGGVAVFADRGGGFWLGEEGSELLEVVGDFGEEAIDFGGDVGDQEEVGEVWEDAGLGVDMHQLGGADGEVCAAEDVFLDGEIPVMFFFDFAGGFDFDDFPGVGGGLMEDVAADDEAVEAEGGFKEAGRACGDRVA